MARQRAVLEPGGDRSVLSAGSPQAPRRSAATRARRAGSRARRVPRARARPRPHPQGAAGVCARDRQAQAPSSHAWLASGGRALPGGSRRDRRRGTRWARDRRARRAAARARGAAARAAARGSALCRSRLWARARERRGGPAPPAEPDRAQQPSSSDSSCAPTGFAARPGPGTAPQRGAFVRAVGRVGAGAGKRSPSLARSGGPLGNRSA